MNNFIPIIAGFVGFGVLLGLLSGLTDRFSRKRYKSDRTRPISGVQKRSNTPRPTHSRKLHYLVWHSPQYLSSVLLADYAHLDCVIAAHTTVDADCLEFWIDACGLDAFKRVLKHQRKMIKSVELVDMSSTKG